MTGFIRALSELVAAAAAFITALHVSGTIDRIWPPIPKPPEPYCSILDNGEEVCVRLLYSIGPLPDFDPLDVATWVLAAAVVGLAALAITHWVWGWFID